MIIIFIPSFINTGPVKGAIALANGLSVFEDVCLVSLKGGCHDEKTINKDVKVISLAGHISLIEKFLAFRRLVNKSCKTSKSVVVSFCFSADLISTFSFSVAHKISSIRSNLIINYRMSYGLIGMALALFHFIILRRFDHVVSMTDAMSKQVYKYSFRKSNVVGNFIDEARIEVFRQHYRKSNHINLVFLGSLTKRKQPDLLLKSLKELINLGLDIHLSLIGDGPLMKLLKQMVIDLSIESHVKFFGQIDEPCEILAKADLMVIPSLSEGLSRAALESLYLGVPVVLRNVDGNAELIHDFNNGMLFNSDDELTEALSRAAAWAKLRDSNKCLLPDMFRQGEAVKQYLKLIRSARK